jgi:hypothetical protein
VLVTRAAREHTLAQLGIWLKNWVSDRDGGKMMNKDKYENLVALPRNAVTEADPRQPSRGLCRWLPLP